MRPSLSIVPRLPRSSHGADRPAEAVFSRVLCATDFSGPSAFAARLARKSASPAGCELHLLHVAPSAHSLGVAARQLGDWARTFAHGAGARTAVRVGVPAAEIVRYAEEHAVDLIVVGCHGATGRSHRLLGSVAERVARTAGCPVLLAPGDRHPASAGPASAPPEPPPSGPCAICKTSSPDLFCESCRARLRLAAPLEAPGRHGEPIEHDHGASPDAVCAGDLSPADVDRVLSAGVVGRLGCAAAGRVYVVPIAYFFDGEALYLRSSEGLKVRMMRASPAVCLQVDHVHDLTSWESAIVFGEFEELFGAEASAARCRLLEGLARHLGGARRPSGEGDSDAGAVLRERDAVVGRIRITEKTGRFEHR